MRTHDEMVEMMLSDPVVEAEYDAQAENFALSNALRAARKRARMTQADVAQKMGTKTPAVCRLEACGRASPILHRSPR